jgi:hypothetical protein
MVKGKEVKGDRKGLFIFGALIGAVAVASALLYPRERRSSEAKRKEKK